GDRCDRLHEAVRRPDPPVGPGQGIQGARHRRLRPQRYAPETARLLRSGPQVACTERTGGSGRPRRHRAHCGCRGDCPLWYRHQQAQPAGLLRSEEMSELIRVPDIGSGEGEVIELFVKVGDRIEAEQSLLTLESDKASMEIPAPKAGVDKSLKVKLGDR